MYISGDELFVDDSLSVRDVGHDAAGIYQCFVSNAAGTVSAAAIVVVTPQRSSRHRQHPSDVQNIAPDGNSLSTLMNVLSVFISAQYVCLL